MKTLRYTWVIGSAHDGMLVRDYLLSVRAFSRQLIKQVKFTKGILLNGEYVTVREKVKSGDELTVRFPPEQRGERLISEHITLDILYEDDALMVINKPAGIAVMPSANQPSGTLANGLIAYYERHELPYTAHIVTRLDRDTSGLMLVAKHQYSHSLLAQSQDKNEVKRTYQAIVEGHLKVQQSTINEPIARKPGSIIERMVSKEGKEAITHYRVIRKYLHHTLVELQLLTGRTHQIRVHMAHIGHPLAGDDLYGGSLNKMNRQALHCVKLSFQHPFTLEPINVTHPFPATLLNTLREQ
jgi:23S rRNA pseudouridine1911/1915/1917 synthase